MPLAELLSLIAIVAVFGAWLASKRNRAGRARRGGLEERLLWTGLAAGLFDSEDCPATSRLEIALVAIARKLGLRAGLVSVSVNGSGRCQVVATGALSSDPLAGLERGTEADRGSFYFGNLLARGEGIAIDYASLSEWRHHPAFAARGWETCIAVNCGLERGESVVVAFFDTVPRGTAFTRAERALVDHLAPWIFTMVASGDGKTGESAAGFRVPAPSESIILDIQRGRGR